MILISKYKKELLSLLLCLWFSMGLSAHEDFLIDTQSPYVLPAYTLEIQAMASAESGDIPGFFYTPQLHYGINDKLNAGASLTLGDFYEEPEFRITSYQLFIKLQGLSKEKIHFYPYASLRHTLGEPITAIYTGDNPTVHTVISQHTDPGLDIGVGCAAKWDLPSIGAGLYFGGDFNRTEFRDYYQEFQSEETYKNRAFLHLTPFWKPDFFHDQDWTLTLAQQHRLTFWNDRGFMYDMLTQGTLQFGDRGNIFLGVTIPLMGGQVYKGFIGGTIAMDLSNPPRGRIVVQDLHFPADQAILFGDENARSEQNRTRIERLYRQLSRFPEYSVIVEGHTSFVHWNDPVEGPAEQENVLIPLSQRRARAVMEALIDLGFPRSRIQAVGRGGSDPQVPFFLGFLQQQNRRVEILLVKPE